MGADRLPPLGGDRERDRTERGHPDPAGDLGAARSADRGAGPKRGRDHRVERIREARAGLAAAEGAAAGEGTGARRAAQKRPARHLQPVEPRLGRRGACDRHWAALARGEGGGRHGRQCPAVEARKRRIENRWLGSPVGRDLPLRPGGDRQRRRRDWVRIGIGCRIGRVSRIVGERNWRHRRISERARRGQILRKGRLDRWKRSEFGGDDRRRLASWERPGVTDREARDHSERRGAHAGPADDEQRQEADRRAQVDISLGKTCRVLSQVGGTRLK